MKIRAKIDAAVVLALGSVITIVSASWFFYERAQVEASIEEQQQSQLRMWAAVCREAKASQSDLALLNYLKVLKATPGLAFAYLVDPRGEIVAHTDARFILRPIKDWTDRNPFAAAIARQEALATEAGPALAVVGFSRAYLQEVVARSARKILRDVLLAGAAAMLVGLLCGWRLSSYFIAQIMPLYEGSERIGSGEFNVSIPVRSSDELGELARRFNEMARKLGFLNEFKETLVANVSHDLRGPLAGITMFAEYLLGEEKGPLNDRQKRMIQLMKVNALHLAMFISNVLDNAKIKDGKMQYIFKPCELSKIVEPIRQLFGMTAELRSVALVVDVPAALPPVNVDAERLEQVLSNMVSNALKFTPAGGKITLSARSAADGVMVTVADTGRGIPPEDLGRLFQKFEQADVAVQKAGRIKGSGLGLAIVKETIERHGGRVWVESVIGKGTAFHFTLQGGHA